MIEPAFIRLLLASSNPGKLREYRNLPPAPGLSSIWFRISRSFPHSTNRRRLLPKTARGKRCTTASSQTASFWRTIPAWLFRHSAARREFTQRDTPDRMPRTRTASANCCAQWRGKKGTRGAPDSSASRRLRRDGRALAVVSDFVEGLIAERAARIEWVWVRSGIPDG